MAINIQNLLSWAAQVFVIASLGALLPLSFRIRHPHSQLMYCHAVLIAALVLPFIQPWRHPIVMHVGGRTPPPIVAPSLPADMTSNPAPAAGLPAERIVLAIFALGVAFKLIWLGLGYGESADIAPQRSPFIHCPSPHRRLWR